MGQKGFEVQCKGRGSGPGKFWNNRAISVAILFAVPTSQTTPPELPFVWDNCSTSYMIYVGESSVILQVCCGYPPVYITKIRGV